MKEGREGRGDKNSYFLFFFFPISFHYCAVPSITYLVLWLLLLSFFPITLLLNPLFSSLSFT